MEELSWVESICMADFVGGVNLYGGVELGGVNMYGGLCRWSQFVWRS